MAGVKGDASPYDGNVSYWVGRNSKLYSGPTAEAIKRQKGKCQHCNRLFMEMDGAVELHPRHRGWRGRPQPLETQESSCPPPRVSPGASDTSQAY